MSVEDAALNQSHVGGWFAIKRNANFEAVGRKRGVDYPAVAAGVRASTRIVRGPTGVLGATGIEARVVRGGTDRIAR